MASRGCGLEFMGADVVTKLHTRIRVSNDRSTFLTLWLEPWGEDYGMLANDEFDVIALEPEKTFYFQIDCGAKDMKVYAEGDASQVSVYQNGEILACGRNRREEEW